MGLELDYWILIIYASHRIPPNFLNSTDIEYIIGFKSLLSNVMKNMAVDISEILLSFFYNILNLSADQPARNSCHPGFDKTLKSTHFLRSYALMVEARIFLKNPLNAPLQSAQLKMRRFNPVIKWHKTVLSRVLLNFSFNFVKLNSKQKRVRNLYSAMFSCHKRVLYDKIYLSHITSLEDIVKKN